MENADTPELTADSEEGFADLCLKMEGLVQNKDGTYRFEARALHKGRPVAFAVALGTTWSPQEIKEISAFLYWGEARLISLGNESDAFIQALDQVYETKVGVSRMRDDVGFTAVSLEGHPHRLATEPLKMKLLFEGKVDVVLPTNLDSQGLVF